ncbi:MAG TPA: hypothetical protein VMN36_18005 [Verrucomicrobiales bacterium]|nr:hypothetical protein [Verrucomicrobiales bacterium]
MHKTRSVRAPVRLVLSRYHLRSLSAACLALFALGACSNTSRDIEITPKQSQDQWTQLRNHFAGYKTGDDGLPDPSIRSGFERNRDYGRTEWEAKSFARKDYPDHPFFRAGKVERTTWKGSSTAPESRSADARIRNRQSPFAGEAYRTPTANESAAKIQRREAPLARTEAESGPSAEHGRTVPLKILRDVNSGQSLSDKEAAKRILELSGRESSMTVDEVRRLLSPDS